MKNRSAFSCLAAGWKTGGGGQRSMSERELINEQKQAPRIEQIPRKNNY
jgi:hypothetical protein